MPRKKPPRKDYVIIPVYLRVNADTAYTGKGVTIAFIDSGFYPHPELAKPDSRILKMTDVTVEKFKESDFELVRASSWHGTMVACVACGSGFSSKGYYRGIANDASVVLIKAFDGKSIRSAAILKALQWILKNHKECRIRIVNISLGGDRNESSKRSRICKTIKKLNHLGITVVAAAGNNPTKGVIPPASCPDVITVGGIDDNNSYDEKKITDYGSSFGRTSDGFMKPEIVAPSRLLPAPMLLQNEIYEESQTLHALLKLPLNELKVKFKKQIKKTKLDQTLINKKPKEIKKAIFERLRGEKFFAPHYQHVDGTSFAAPIVSSIIAQMLEVNPKLTPSLIKMILTTTARRLPDIVPEKQGYGLITARACVQRALEETHLHLVEVSPKILKHRIVFYYHDHHAKKVTLVGDFTAWQKDMIVLHKVEEGFWRIDIPLLSEGSYQYKFLIDDKRWAEDPQNPLKENDHYNGLNSVLIVQHSS